MDQFSQEVLRFDRFTLDLVRGCLRVGDRDIALRPKTFEVLRHLAESAGRLVPKQELYNVVWPNVIVSDDSLVQCIRELRDNLGDEGRCLIKTVPRRGYLLDVAVTTATPQFLSEGTVKPTKGAPNIPTDLGMLRGALRAVQSQGWRLRAAAAAGALCASLGAIYLSALFANQWQTHVRPAEPAPMSMQAPVSEFFTERDVKRVAALADDKQLPLPPFKIGKPARDVPEGIRRFVGIWVSDTGWVNSNRQHMLIITDVNGDGTAAGYFANGPSQPKSFIQSPPHFGAFKARISGASLSYSNMMGEYVASFTAQDRIELKVVFRDGLIAWVAHDPVWTLVDAERAAGR